MIHDASLLCIIKLFYFEQYYYIAICFFCQHSRLWINCELFVEPCKTICLTELILTRKIPYTIMKSEKSIEIGTQGQELGGTPKQGRCRVSPQCTQEQSCHWFFSGRRVQAMLTGRWSVGILTGVLPFGELFKICGTLELKQGCKSTRCLFIRKSAAYFPTICFP